MDAQHQAKANIPSYAGAGQYPSPQLAQPNAPQDTLRARFGDTKQALQVAHQIISQIENSVDITPAGTIGGEIQKTNDTLTNLSFDMKESALALVERLHRLLQRL